MKKIISLTSLLAVSAAALTPVLMTQNMLPNMLPKSSFGYTPPPTPYNYNFVSKFDFNNDASKYTISSHAQYYTGKDPGFDTCIARFQAFLSPAAARAMWKFTTDGPESGHPANNYMWWLNGYVAGFGKHIEQAGDYLVSITEAYQHQHADGSIIEDFERVIGGSLWSKIENYIKNDYVSSPPLELSFQYDGVVLGIDGFYVNASWPH